MVSGISSKQFIQGEREQVKIWEIDEIRLTMGWLLKLGDGYVGVHCTGVSNKYVSHFHSKKQEKKFCPLKEHKARMVLQVTQILKDG